jgi:excisionase family DNA binding protein
MAKTLAYPKGSVIVFSSGRYSDYGLIAFVVAVADLDLPALAKEYVAEDAAKPEDKRGWDHDEPMFRADYRARDVWTAEETADYLGCSAAYVNGMVRAGKLKHFRLGRLLRFRRSDVEEYAGCASSGSETASTPTGEREGNPKRSRSELRIVRLPSDG